MVMDANRVRSVYRWMAPVYDPLFRRFYAPMRRRSIARLRLAPADTVALIGVGTGLDLPWLPPAGRVVAVDFSPGMLRRAVRNNPGASAVLADGAKLPFRDGSVDAIVLHLVLSVAPEPHLLLADAVRVLRDGGRIAVLDHFAPQGRLSWWRRLVSRLTWLFGTHFDRHFEPIAAGLPLTIIVDRTFTRGLYRSLLLRKDAPAGAATEIPSQCRFDREQNS